jgi:hypothetical protein
MTDQSIEDASRSEFEAAHKELYGDTCRYRINKETGKYIENGEQLDWELWQAARQSSQSEPVANKQTPYANCQFQICDLPGQCKGAGRCHHPVTVADIRNLAAPQQAIPSGWKLVPVELTETMRDNAAKCRLNGQGVDAIYAAILSAVDYELSASPTAPIESDK